MERRGLQLGLVAVCPAFAGDRLTSPGGSGNGGGFRDIERRRRSSSRAGKPSGSTCMRMLPS